MTVPKWLRIVAVSAVALLIVLVGGLWTYFELTGPMSRCRGHRGFDAAAWRDPKQAYGPLAVRGCMVDDLIAQRRLKGRTRAEVVALLGEPRPTVYFQNYDLVYWLGPERGWISIDSEWLVFRLDATRRVAEYRLVTD